MYILFRIRWGTDEILTHTGLDIPKVFDTKEEAELMAAALNKSIRPSMEWQVRQASTEEATSPVTEKLKGTFA
ncbi:hypothetical protein [Alkalicoccus luteus]|uniref:Uncharacterized protein n=1 Tax=Alkalicoccus luteus TaxID=1237094 RepID=A0A969PU78_9BACI|nr:hypothetical protein [Alkalicoccus luteus]NJP38476.1 hypothetical protein [Alkalicoccus luteus]